MTPNHPASTQAAGKIKLKSHIEAASCLVLASLIGTFKTMNKMFKRALIHFNGSLHRMRKAALTTPIPPSQTKPNSSGIEKMHSWLMRYASKFVCRYPIQGVRYVKHYVTRTQFLSLCSYLFIFGFEFSVLIKRIDWRGTLLYLIEYRYQDQYQYLTPIS